MSSTIEVQRKCEYCQETFVAKTTVTRYCSHRCNQRHYKQRKREEKLAQHEQEQQVVRLAIPEADYGTLQVKEFLSIKETSVLLGISERTLYRLMANSSLPAKKIGRRTIITRAAIDELLK